MSSSPDASSPAPFFNDDPSHPASTAPSSPPCGDTSRGTSVVDLDIADDMGQAIENHDVDDDMKRRLARLKTVLEKSLLYSSFLRQQLEQDKQKYREMMEQQAGAKRRRTNRDTGKGRKKQKTNESTSTAEPDDNIDDAFGIFQQPKLITGAKLKPYQLEGLQWMVSLDQNGMSGILADEMGLGKTLQTIAFSAYLREKNNTRPFLIVCPLSVLHNWVAEYERFAPEIPVVMYHGTPAEREEMRRTAMALNSTDEGAAVAKAMAAKKVAAVAKTKAKKAANAKAAAKKKAQPPPPRPATFRSGRTLRRSTRFAGDAEPAEEETITAEADEEVQSENEDEVSEGEDDANMNEDGSETADPAPSNNFPVVVTTYDIIMRDRAALSAYQWGYIVVDEGHRLKNLNCKLMTEIKKYSSAGRMILTGTPLHNNLAELWSLLNFILPDIFNDIEAFQEWFNLPTLQSTLSSDHSSNIIASLHAILKPFLLRRLKVDVALDLPPKKEYVLYAPLSVRQREAYQQVLDGGLRDWLINGGTEGSGAVSALKAAAADAESKATSVKGKAKADDSSVTTRNRLAREGRKSYAVDGDDDEYFDMVENGEVDDRGLIRRRPKEEDPEELARLGFEHQVKMKVKQVNNMRLQNTVMQLRKVCSHPFLFDWPIDPKTREQVIGEELVNASGKMMVLDRLLRALFERKHKVLIFSQFTTMLDIIQDWAVEHMGWIICRIDGTSSPLERKAEMERFQNGGDAPDAPILFLLSTRAGGLGINLVAADTVIFYDQDWNPQMDAQAQDRAHRIGQTKPVLIFRLVSAHTIETSIMARASEKRKLEALVIAKGKFRKPAAEAQLGSKTRRETAAEMATELLRLEGEKIEVVPDTKEGKARVLSDEDLDILLDRSPEVFEQRGKGWTSSSGAFASTTNHAAESVISKSPKKTKGKAVSKGKGKGARVPGNGGKEVKRAAFAVYEAPAEEEEEEEDSEAIAMMFGEQVADD